MLENIIRLSIRQRWTVIVVALLIAGLGIYNFGRLKIDAKKARNTLSQQSIQDP